LIQSGESKASWDTDPSETYGNVVKLVGVSGSDARVGLLIENGPTLATIDWTKYGYEYYTETEGLKVPEIEFRFIGPECVDPDDESSVHRAHVDITLSLTDTTVKETWTLVSVAGTEDVTAFGNKLDGTPIGPITGNLPSVINGITSELGIEASALVLTRVSPQVGWSVVGTYYVDHITIDGGGSHYDLEPPTKTVESNTNGYFKTTYRTDSEDSGVFTVSAIDGPDNSFAKTTFNVGPTVSLSKDEGPSGTVVTITGRGFTSQI